MHETCRNQQRPDPKYRYIPRYPDLKSLSDFEHITLLFICRFIINEKDHEEMKNLRYIFNICIVLSFTVSLLKSWLKIFSLEVASMLFQEHCFCCVFQWKIWTQQTKTSDVSHSVQKIFDKTVVICAGDLYSSDM